MPEKVRRRSISPDGLLNQRREKVKHLLRCCISADIVIAAFHLQRFCGMGQDFIPAVSCKTVEQHTHIGAAKVKRKIIAALLPRRQP